MIGSRIRQGDGARRRKFARIKDDEVHASRFSVVPLIATCEPRLDTTNPYTYPANPACRREPAEPIGCDR
jgi:hypothetical protein